MAVLAKTLLRNKHMHLLGGADGPDFGNKLVIKLPHLRVLSLVARSLLLATVIATFPWIESVIRSSASEANGGMLAHPASDLLFLPALFQDLKEYGLLKLGTKALYIGQPGSIPYSGELNVDLISQSDDKQQQSVPDQTFDFAYTAGFSSAQFIDRALKVDGIAAVRLLPDPSKVFTVPPNFRIVYVRQFNDSTVVAIRKFAASASSTPASVRPPTSRRLLDFDSDAKRAALVGLEDALLEPPRSPSRRSKQYMRRIRYLPQLTGDSLAEYPRRVFITVGESGGGDGWFERNYPVMSRAFVKYRVETVSNRGGGEWAPLGMSEWLQRNVREEEYVVMKAEAEVVEEMVKSKAIGLVDELFLECSHQGQKGKSKSRRAYWECLALYGKLRDQGVAVHQWWG